jgi:Beta-agarase/YXIM esterase-like, galactose-binding domain-like
MRSNRWPYVVIVIGIWALTCSSAWAAKSISVVSDPNLAPSARHGLNELVSAIQSKGFVVRQQRNLGKSSSAVTFLLASRDSNNIRLLSSSAPSLDLPSEPESLLIRKMKWKGREVVLLYGADARGLMYAALDVAEEVRLGSDGSDLANSVIETSEKPFIKERGLSKVVMNQSEFEKYFYSPEYWSHYLDLLARSRFNNFVLMLGYSSAGYLDPPYPWFFNITEFPQVRAVGVTTTQQQRNVEAIRQIIRMAHERGMEFTLAIWTDIYRPKKNQSALVAGLNDKNLIAYNQAGLSKFLKLVPGIDRLQFRVHVESSVELPEQIPFWNSVLKVVKDSRQHIKVDMRAKGFYDDMINAALSSGVPIRVATKYWGEQMGLPYHSSHIEIHNQYDRARSDYADLLRYPKRYDILWRLWNLGTTRILLWGDPEYVRRFAKSCLLYDGPEGAAYEVSEPLAFKMGHHRGPTYDLLSQKYRYYRWEFERYWYFYEVWGRVGYGSESSPRIWQLEFNHRFGKPTAPFVEQAYHSASWILGRINAYSLGDLSADYAWAEKQRWGDLPDYVNYPPSDTDQFIGIQKAVDLYLAGKHDARIWPQQTASWFEKTGDTVLDEVEKAEQVGVPETNREFVSTMIDMQVLANLALYHSRRIYAGLSYALFKRTQDLNELDDAIRYEQEAIDIWEKIVNLTNGVYYSDLIMGGGPRLTGNWNSELTKLEQGMQKLEAERDHFAPHYQEVVRKFDFGPGPLEPSFLRVSSNTRKQRYDPLEGGYGWLHASLSRPPEHFNGRGFVYGPPPSGYTTGAFNVDLPNGYYEVQFTMHDTSDKPRNYGPMWIELSGRDSTDHFQVPAGQIVQKSAETEVRHGRLGIVFRSGTGAQWLMNRVVITRITPKLADVPVRRSVPGRELKIRTTFSGPSPLREMRLYYGAADTGYRSINMESTGRMTYSGTIPKTAVLPGLSYMIKADDTAGREVRQGPFHVLVTDDNKPPVITVDETETSEGQADKPLTVRAQVEDPSGVESVWVRFRSVNQKQDYATIQMLPTGRNDEYTAQIPGSYLDPRWNFMYFIEAFDNKGNGTIFPDLNKEAPYIVVSLHR